jgi:hypothetical protein
LLTSVYRFQRVLVPLFIHNPCFFLFIFFFFFFFFQNAQKEDTAIMALMNPSFSSLLLYAVLLASVTSLALGQSNYKLANPNPLQNPSAQQLIPYDDSQLFNIAEVLWEKVKEGDPLWPQNMDPNDPFWKNLKPDDPLWAQMQATDPLWAQKMSTPRSPNNPYTPPKTTTPDPRANSQDPWINNNTPDPWTGARTPQPGGSTNITPRPGVLNSTPDPWMKMTTRDPWVNSGSSNNNNAINTINVISGQTNTVNGYPGNAGGAGVTGRALATGSTATCQAALSACSLFDVDVTSLNDVYQQAFVTMLKKQRLQHQADLKKVRDFFINMFNQAIMDPDNAANNLGSAATCSFAANQPVNIYNDPTNTLPSPSSIADVIVKQVS